MAIDRDPKYRERVVRGKYQRLYAYLSGLQAQEWRTSFSEIESILGFELPASARRHRPWWANQRSSGGHSHALAWVVDGWDTAEVDMGSETLLFRRRERPQTAGKPSLDEVWPAHPTAVWPKGASLRREDMYADITVGVVEHSFAGYSFECVGPIQPKRDGRGEVIGELPQPRYRNENNLPLNNYGKGPFCRFRVARGWQSSGVYILMKGEEPLYAGETQNLEDRWGSIGYGGISPRNCYKGGQETNCRINNLIYRDTKTGAGFELWFHPVEGDKRARGSRRERIDRFPKSALEPHYPRHTASIRPATANVCPLSRPGKLFDEGKRGG